DAAVHPVGQRGCLVLAGSRPGRSLLARRALVAGPTHDSGLVGAGLLAGVLDQPPSYARIPNSAGGIVPGSGKERLEPKRSFPAGIYFPLGTTRAPLEPGGNLLFCACWRFPRLAASEPRRVAGLALAGLAGVCRFGCMAVTYRAVLCGGGRSNQCVELSGFAA